VEEFLQSFFNDLKVPTATTASETPQLSDEIISEVTPAPSTFIDDASIEEFKQATIEKLLEQPKNLSEETGSLMEEIRLNTYLFDRKKQLAAYLKQETVSIHMTHLKLLLI
jgi:secreted Zn-dependent insulinase-like peptidase